MGVEVGQLYIVQTDVFFTSGRFNKFNRPVNIKKDEIIEIRYPCRWHFRTEDNFYFHCKEDDLLLNCKLYGTIWEKVRFDNKTKLSDILKFKLYDLP